MTLRIGLTGGIGSGKSTVANFFQKLGVPVIDADQIAHEITEPNQPALKKIVMHFGEDILDNNEALRRAALRKIIFENPHEKVWLEKLLHPLIRKKMKEAIDRCHYPYCILVIPLLAESKGITFIDRVLVVDAPMDLQIQRAKQRDDVSDKAIKAIIDSQCDHHERLAIADDIINNDADLTTLQNKVQQLHQKYLNLAQEANHDD